MTASNSTPLVHVPGLGTLQGRRSDVSEKVALFLGVPYASPPVGDLRWRSPRHHGPWQSPRDATHYRSTCVSTEDCLFLNVAAPVAVLSSAERLPVIVFIHGGAYVEGASDFSHPDSLVAHSQGSVIVVTINYRLHVFGFLGSPELQNRSADGSAGNYGLEDQRLALAWVRDHITAFGGNGQIVTIFGQSAGGNSVLHHLTQPRSYNLYTRAISDSGSYRATRPMKTATAQYERLLKATGCQTLDCLLQLDTKHLLQARWKLGFWGPTIDFVSVLGDPLKRIEAGQYSRVPVLLGSNRDEFAVVMAAFGSKDMGDKGLDFVLGRYAHLGENASDRLRAAYDPSVYAYPEFRGGYSQQWWTAMRIQTDNLAYLGHCSERHVAQALVRSGSPAVFLYMFAQRSNKSLRSLSSGGKVLGTWPGSPFVPHSAELPYVFVWERSLDASELHFAQSVSNYWSQFARTGDPNFVGATFWPHFDVAGDTILRLEAKGIASQTGCRKAACDLWDELEVGKNPAGNFLPTKNASVTWSTAENSNQFIPPTIQVLSLGSAAAVLAACCCVCWKRRFSRFAHCSLSDDKESDSSSGDDSDS